MVVKNGDEFHGGKYNITLNKSERMHKKKDAQWGWPIYLHLP